jgi:hypothetical protein
MTKIRRGGYVFVTWKADHPPRHVHVFRDGRLVAKWNLDAGRMMTGTMTRRLHRMLEEIVQEGLL